MGDISKDRHWHGRLIEAVGGALMRIGIPVPPLSERSLCGAAKLKTRLKDFGDDAFREPLRLLLDDLNRDEGLGIVGRFASRILIVEGLVNRLRIAEALELDPSIEAVEVRRPLLVVGMPRTGTTLLHNLLAADPNGRAPQMWELDSPWPARNPRDDRPDPRIAKLKRRIEMMNRANPDNARIHEFHADGPEECHHLFRNAMATQTFRAFSDVPGFLKWKLEHDMLPEYRYYLLQLKMLLSQRPAGHLVLKFPGHAWHLDALFAVLPDARVVFTHRDPMKIVGSFCSMVASVRRGVRREFDPISLGPLLAEEIETGLRRMMRWRESADPSRFIDVRYADLVEDPLREVARIYDHFGDTVPEAMESGAREWLARNRQHRHGKHEYSLADFGLDESAVRERFAFYDLHGEPAVSA